LRIKYSKRVLDSLIKFAVEEFELWLASAYQLTMKTT